ncbi:hypothetical protein IE53DRAFT_313880 [Violaceomyces palustris]|uniref:Uncharacterized protein n=1 Tax=Violaceomyces palustris TaxID=1673888 RepID=A0ACD0NZZ6_9BASI|nr:hypothetical protein IE53DRAFT_313880 [Violaceomyces palustris]
MTIQQQPPITSSSPTPFQSPSLKSITPHHLDQDPLPSSSSSSSSSPPPQGIQPSLDPDQPATETRQPGSFYTRKDGEDCMTWDSILQVITKGDLDQLNRHPRCEEEYRLWSPSIRREWGCLENYIRVIRLGWGGVEDQAQELTPSSPSPSDQTPPMAETWPEVVLPHPGREGTLLTHFVGDVDLASSSSSSSSSSLVKVIENDWPYGIPQDCKHWVVWSKLAILHPNLFKTNDTPFQGDLLRQVLFEMVAREGARGLTGFEDDEATRIYGTRPEWIPERWRSILEQKHGGKEGEHDDEIRTLFQLKDQEVLRLTLQAHIWASRYMRSYVESIWSSDRFQTAWFCNPPHLRTVPGKNPKFGQGILPPPRSQFFSLPPLPSPPKKPHRPKSFPVEFPLYFFFFFFPFFLFFFRTSSL